MQVIYFKENQKNQRNEFIAENCSESFLQSWEWGEFQKSLGRRVWRIGIVGDNLSSEDKTIKSQIPNPKSQTNFKSQIPNKSKLPVTNCQLLAVALIVKHDLPFGKSYLYCPRGPVLKVSSIKYQVSSVLDLLFCEIKKIAEREKSLFLRIDPPMKLNNESRITDNEYPFNFKKSPNEIQPRDTLILDLTKSEEELLKEMKQKTRYNIRLAEKKGIKIRGLEYSILNLENFKKSFEEFWKLVEETSVRDKFVSHSGDYYWKMLESLAEDNLQSASNIAIKNQESRNNNQKIIKSQISNLKQSLRAKLYLAEYNNKIIVANIVLYFGDLAVYLHGASSSKYRNLMAPYLLQWRQILDAKKAGCKKYDFWGVSREAKTAGNLVFSRSDWQGITRFKKGFGGEEKNYIGAYDLIFNNIGYVLYEFIKFIKLKARKVIKANK